MDPIYVTGHRNPDTDSIVAAMAYAELRHALGDREYEAACLGRVSDETQTVLDRFGFQPPTLIHDVYNQVRDLDYDTPPVLSAAVTIEMAWKTLQENPAVSAIPVANEDGTLYGMLSKENVATYNMDLVANAYLKDVPLFNVLAALEGRVMNEAGDSVDTISGKVTIALPHDNESLLFNRKDSIVMCGDQPDMIRRALEMNVTAVVLCQSQMPEELMDIPTTTCIITTPYAGYRAARMIFQSVPIGRMCRKDDLVCFHLEDRIDMVREQVLKHREHCYPILDASEKVVGILTRYHLLRPRRKRVVLVDHNEAAQSVPGLEEAEILEIIDHHRLADIQTANPVYVRNEPVGSSNTIIAGMYQDHGLMPSKGIAGMMAAAILSDTVMFKSPTCTERDRKVAERLARMAGESLEELGKAIFSGSMDGKPVADLLSMDYKEFHIAGYDLAVSQLTVVDCSGLIARKDEFLEVMREKAKRKKLTMVLLMLTDVLQEGTELLYIGDDDTIQQAFGFTPKDNMVFLPHVMSRKKQIIPMLSTLWG